MAPKRVFGFWLCAIEYSKCHGCYIFDLKDDEKDEIWQTLAEEERELYKNKAKEYNHRYGADARRMVYDLPVQVRHWREGKLFVLRVYSLID